MLTALLDNLALVTLFAFASSLLYRHWPPRHTPGRTLIRATVAGVASLTLMAFPFEVAPGVGADLSHVPTGLVTLRYGVLWGLLTATPALLFRAVEGGPGVMAAALSTFGVLLVAGLLHGRARLTHLPSWRIGWVAPLIFSLDGLGLLLLDDGVRLLRQVYVPLLLANSLAFVIALYVIHSRLMLLRATSTYREQAYTDPLTGLANRRQFDETVDTLLPGEHLLVLDIDHFKRLNDAFGHAVGDEVLQHVAGALLNAVRAQDRVYRYGGEEFVVLLRAVNSAQAARAAERCRAAARAACAPALEITLSGGLAQRSPHESVSRTFERADAALYVAKDGGRDRLHISEDDPSPVPSVDPAPPSWPIVRGTLALLSLDQDPARHDWQTLLEAAVASVPKAEAGTLYIVRDGDFELCAQKGFSEDLIGQRQSPTSQRLWYGGTDEEWRTGRPRVLREQDVFTSSKQASLIDHNPSGHQTFEEAGRVGDITESLGVPVVVDGQVVAFLNLDRFGAELAFDEQARRVATEFASQAAVLLAARARRQREIRRARELEALARVTTALRDAHGAAEVASALTGMTHELLGTQQAVYLTYDAEQDRLVSGSVLGVPGGRGAVSLPRGTGLAWAALESREVLRVANVHDDARVYRPDFLLARAMLAAPLRSARGMWGVLIVTRDDPFGEDDAQLVRTMVAHGVTALERAAHVRTLESAREGTLLALGRVVEARDGEVLGHTERVTARALALGTTMGLSREQLSALRDGAYLHDVGKVQVPDRVLLKPGPLSPDEWTVMRAHAAVGETLARHVPGVCPEALNVVRHHHERWDGTGYPDGLSGEAIPLLARLFAVVDVYDALTNERPYKRAWTPEQARAEIAAQAGRQFDPRVVDVFLTVLSGESQHHPVGSVPRT